jgi:hypothetical protein
MDVDWINITTLGDEYEVEMSTYGGQYRHRLMTLPRPSFKDEFLSHTEWIPGRPPSGHHANKKTES